MSVHFLTNSPNSNYDFTCFQMKIPQTFKILLFTIFNFPSESPFKSDFLRDPHKNRTPK